MRALALLLCLLSAQAWGVDLDIGSNGAVGDGITDDTVNLQTSLTDCSNNGKTCVVESGKNYRITGPIFMWGAGSLRGADSTSTISSEQTTKFPFNVGVSPGAAPYTSAAVWTGTISNVTFDIVSQSVNGRFIMLYRSRGATITGNRYYNYNFPMSLTGSGVDGAYLSGAGNYIRERIRITNNTVIGEITDEAVQQEGIGLDHFDGAEFLYNTVTGVGDDPIGCHICTDVTIKYNRLSSVDGRIYLSNVARSEVSYNDVSRVADSTGVFHAGVALIMQTFEDHSGGDAYSDPAPQDFSIHHNTLTLPAGAVEPSGGSIYLVGVRTKRRGENSVKYNSIINNSSGVNRTSYQAILLTPMDPIVGTWTDPDALDTTVAKIRNTLTIEGNVASGDYPLSMANTGASSGYYTGTTTFKNNTADTFVLIYDPAVRNVDNDPITADWYASASGGAAASCVDSGANVCTLARAITVSTAGDTIEAACETHDLTAAAFALNKSVLVRPPLGCTTATITSTGATSGFTLQMAGENHPAAARLKDFTISQSVAQNQIVTISNAAFDSNVELNGVTVSGTNLARHINDANTRGNTKLIDVTLTGTVGTAGTPSGYVTQVTPAGGGKRVYIDGLTTTLTGSGASFSAVHIERAASSTVALWASVKNSTIAATAISTFRAIGVKFNRVSSGTDLNGNPADSTVEDNDITVTAAATSTAESKAIEVGSTDATATGNNVKVRRNTATCYSPVARCLSLAADETTANFAAGVEFSANEVIGTYYDGTSIPIGMGMGRVQAGRFLRNSVTGFGIGFDISMTTDGQMFGNITLGSTAAAAFLEGNTSLALANNTFVADDSILGAKHGNYGLIGVAVQGATNNAAAAISNNLLQVRSGAAWKFNVVDASQVATFTTNDYDATPPLTNEWSYQGVANDTLAAWQAAQEAGALGVAPGFTGGSAPTSIRRSAVVSTSAESVGAGTIPPYSGRAMADARRSTAGDSGAAGFCLASASALLGAGTYIGAYIYGYGGESLSNPPPIGARGLCNPRRATSSRRAATR